MEYEYIAKGKGKFKDFTLVLKCDRDTEDFEYNGIVEYRYGCIDDSFKKTIINIPRLKLKKHIYDVDEINYYGRIYSAKYCDLLVFEFDSQNIYEKYSNEQFKSLFKTTYDELSKYFCF